MHYQTETYQQGHSIYYLPLAASRDAAFLAFQLPRYLIKGIRTTRNTQVLGRLPAVGLEGREAGSKGARDWSEMHRVATGEDRGV